LDINSERARQAGSLSDIDLEPVRQAASLWDNRFGASFDKLGACRIIDLEPVSTSWQLVGHRDPVNSLVASLIWNLSLDLLKPGLLLSGQRVLQPDNESKVRALYLAFQVEDLVELGERLPLIQPFLLND
jgi:hypothetical protein